MVISKLNSIFEEEYKKLNKEQKEAVDTIEGPVMVIAGPGTGKTSILTLRIANILKKTDTAPENILSLTFTESGAYAMRKKLVGIIGPTAYRVNINTFHSFCNEVIKNYPEKFPRIIGSTAINNIDQISVMEKIIENNDFEFLKPFGDIFYYVKKALDEIRDMKREAIGPDEFEAIIKKQQKDFDATPDKINEKGAHKGKMKGEFIKLQEYIEKNRELLIIYRAYEEALRKDKFYDFEDMIMEVLKTLKKDKNLLLILQENYQYILADEHQDANNAQNAILELLSNFHKDPNLFIVGDEKQAIFRFQGASLQNFLYFQKIYPKAKIINLKENYRSTQKILDASHSLIENNSLPSGLSRVALLSKSQKLGNANELIHIYEFPKEEAELSFIAKEIKKQIDNGEKPEEIAILYRENREAVNIGKMLEKFNITTKSPLHFLRLKEAFKTDESGDKTHWLSIGYLVILSEEEVSAMRINEPDKFDELGWFNLDNLPTPLHSLITPELITLIKNTYAKVTAK
jgi:DNA helicase-2/ATP-dependent DNA helicase PcrA